MIGYVPSPYCFGKSPVRAYSGFPGLPPGETANSFERLKVPSTFDRSFPLIRNSELHAAKSGAPCVVIHPPFPAIAFRQHIQWPFVILRKDRSHRARFVGPYQVSPVLRRVPGFWPISLFHFWPSPSLNPLPMSSLLNIYFLSQKPPGLFFSRFFRRQPFRS